MSARARRRALWPRLGAVLVASSLLVFLLPAPANAASFEQIQGSGSSWAYGAVNQWVTDVTAKGVEVVFTPSGSAQGRQDFANGVTDFGVSDIGYQGVDPQNGQDDVSNRPYAYLPMVAGGTAFPYNIVVGGQRVTNLRLSGLTLAKIFTDQITNWDDPEITADNNGHALPSIPIIPVVHSEGAGSTYQFTDWLYTEYPQLWESFTKSAAGQAYSFPVEFWPTGAGNQVAENGSDGVMNFVKSSAGQGSIGFDEYYYALAAGFPVVPIENSAGYFTYPDAYDVAVSLTQAQINYNTGSPDYLLETLNNVYTYSDDRDYPLSSYTYEIEPTSASDSTVLTTGKAQSLATFTSYSICQGQAEMAPIGYSPLPINLVQASYQQIQKLQQANPGISLSGLNVASCNNPTFEAGQPNANFLATIAPQPPACAKAGQGPCTYVYAHNGNPRNGQAGGLGVTHTPTGGSGGGSTTSSGGSSGGGSSGGGSSGGGSSTGGSSGGSTGTTASSASPGSGSSAASATRSANGGSANATAGSAGPAQSNSTTSADLVATPTNLAASSPLSSTDTLFAVAGAIALLVVLALPPVVRRRRRNQ